MVRVGIAHIHFHGSELGLEYFLQILTEQLVYVAQILPVSRFTSVVFRDDNK